MRRNMPFVAVGGSSILTIFAMLCLIVCALLSLSIAKADSILANKSMDAERNYYRADTEAEEMLAAIRGGGHPAGVVRRGNVYSYACAIDENQELQVEAELDGNAFRIIRWQKKYVNHWEADRSMEVWEGPQEIME